VEENYRRSPDADTDASATDAAPNRAATASAPETGVIVKPRKSRPRDEDPMPPAAPPAREPARTGSDSDGAMPENR
jgi:hypothetical protein